MCKFYLTVCLSLFLPVLLHLSYNTVALSYASVRLWHRRCCPSVRPSVCLSVRHRNQLATDGQTDRSTRRCHVKTNAHGVMTNITWGMGRGCVISGIALCVCEIKSQCRSVSFRVMQVSSRSSAVAERPRDASCHWIFRQVIQWQVIGNCTIWQIHTTSYWRSIVNCGAILIISEIKRANGRKSQFLCPLHWTPKLGGPRPVGILS